MVTALVLGTDSRSNDWGGLADTIIVAQLSADRKNLHLVSITRDSYVEIPGYNRGKINSAFGKGGIPLLRDTVSHLLGGLEIDLVVQTNFNGFIALTRAMDGFTVDNKHANSRKVISTGRVVDFPKGPVKLENTDGLIYVRERKGLPRGDLDRAERGRAALIGMMKRLVEITDKEPAKLAELFPMVYRNVKVEGDLGVEQLPALVELGRNFAGGSGKVTSLMVPIADFATVGGQSVNRLDSGRTAELGEALKAGDLSAYVAKYGEDYAPTGRR
ncbi:MAG TPA: LCP family protein [Tessaracoccus flavescens]|uniref:LCP family protein n=1 Tax=Tessaracoccus flavescens TaxID=399497 RepID=A0A921JQ43_9ACTN|nr:LCP family protein [Tessaracoccus flavescens]